MKTLMPHQEKALSWALKRARIALFMEMRLGKSLVAIRWAKAQKEAHNWLILAPSAALPGWREELLGDGIKELDICNLEAFPSDMVYEIVLSYIKNRHTRRTWFLMNYEKLTANPNLFKLMWGGVICDESTKIRNPQSEISKALNKQLNWARYKANLSGCPAPEWEGDYFQQMLFLYDGFMGESSFWNWRKKYCLNSGYDWTFNKTFKNKMDQELSELTFTLSRKDAGMGEKKVYEKRYVDMNFSQIGIYKHIEEDFEYSLEGKTSMTKWAPVKYNWMQQVAGGFGLSENERVCISNTKLNEIKYLLKTELKKEKVVIWFKHNWELEYAFICLTDMKCAIYTGDKKGGEEAFKNGDCQVMLAQGKCASMALDWSAASTAIYYSNWPDGEIRMQTEDRIVNVRKKEPLLYIDLITKDTIDEDIYDLLKGKKTKAQGFMSLLNKRMKEKYQ